MFSFGRKTEPGGGPAPGVVMYSGYAIGEARCKDCRQDLGGSQDSLTPGMLVSELAGTAEFFYMVTDRVWRAAGMPSKPGTFLCVGCLEERLGRELAGEDFKPNASANWPMAQDTARLAERKRRIVRPAGASFASDMAAENAEQARKAMAGGSRPRPVPKRGRRKARKPAGGRR